MLAPPPLPPTQVKSCVQLSKKALEDGMCVVVGMQSTGGGWVKLREPGQVKQSHHATHKPPTCLLEHDVPLGAR